MAFNSYKDHDMTPEQIREKVRRLQTISLTTDVYLPQADVDVELQGDTHIVTVDDVEGESEVNLNLTTLQQLSDIEMLWLVKTCREILTDRML